MEDFLLNNRAILIRSFEILAAVTGTLLYKKYKNTAAKYFIYFLIYVAFIEIIGSYPRYVANYDALANIRDLLKNTVLEKNRWWYTLFWKIGAVIFFSFYYFKILKNTFNKKLLLFSLIIFILSCLILITYTWPLLFEKTFPFISVFGALVILQCAFYYFFEILQSNNVLNFYKSINFYISSAILIFWLVKTPLIFYEIYFTAFDKNYVKLRGLINVFVIFFMYTTFTIGLIVSNPEPLNK